MANINELLYEIDRQLGSIQLYIDELKNQGISVLSVEIDSDGEQKIHIYNGIDYVSTSVNPNFTTEYVQPEVNNTKKIVTVGETDVFQLKYDSEDEYRPVEKGEEK